VRRFATAGQAQTFGDAVGEPTAGLVVPTSLRIRYDRRTDVLSITMRKGEPKYVAAGRGAFAIFADDEGMWSVDLEAKSWDSNADETFPLMKIEIWQSAVAEKGRCVTSKKQAKRAAKNKPIGLPL